MRSYNYVARDTIGIQRTGLRTAACTNDVVAWLREQGLTPISVSEVAEKIKQARWKVRRKKRIKSAEIAAVCWQLNTMIEGGISVTAALDTIADDIDNLKLGNALKQISQKIQKGQSLSDSIAGFTKIFNPLSQAIILAGETSGNLADALRRVAEYFDNKDKLSKKVKKAMAYPIFVVVFIFLILAFIMAFIIPRFRIIFDQMGGQLPVFTRAFIGFYDVLMQNLPYVIGFGVLGTVLAVLAHTRTRQGHYWSSKIVLRLPLIGKVCRQAFITAFCNTMSSLIDAGVSVLDTFDILEQLSRNNVIKNAVIKTRENIVQGLSIAASMAKSSRFFPNMVIKMVEVGEKSGSLSRVLERTSDYYERKVDATISALMALLEPILIVTIGAIVLVIVLALYLPIFTMSEMAS